MKVRMKVSDDDVRRYMEQVIHLSQPPYTHGLCGTPRGDKSFKPDATASCVVCLGLRGMVN